MILVEEIDGVKRAYVLSNYDAEQFSAQLSKGGQENPLRKKVCLFTSSGELASLGPQGAGFTLEEFEALQHSDWLKQKVCEVSFWNGKVADTQWMEAALSPENPEQRGLVLHTWQTICKKHANPQHLQKSMMEELIKGKEDVLQDAIEGDLIGAAEYGFQIPQKV